MAFKHRLFAGIAISLFAGAVYAQPPQFKYSAPATATYPGPIVSNPPTGITSASQALLSTQHFHGVTTNLRGSLLNIATDDADTGSTNAIGLYMPYTYGGPNATGNRIGISVDMFRSAATSISSSAKNYVGIQGQIVSSSGDGGTGFTATTAKGADFGVAGACVELAGATFLLNCTGGEFDSAMETDSSVAIKSIVQLEGQAVDAVQGNNIDTMLLMYDSVGAIGHVNAINIGNGGGSSFGNKFPVSSGGTIFVSSGGSVAKGIDFTGDTFSSSAFASPGFSVDGSGNIIVNGCTGCGGSGGGTVTTSGSPSAGQIAAFSGSTVIGPLAGFTAAAGGAVIGSPTGGAKGAGSLNLGALWINGVQASAYSTSGTGTQIPTTQAPSIDSPTITTQINLPATSCNGLKTSNTGLLSCNNNLIITTQSGTAYTFVLADAASVMEESTSGSATSFTIPPNSSVAFPIGTLIPVQQGGAGKLTIVAGAGVTVNFLSTATAALLGQYSVAELVQTAANVWTLFGGIGG